MKGITNYVINANRARYFSSMETAKISDEARFANEIQAETGCSRTEALIAASQILSKAT